MKNLWKYSLVLGIILMLVVSESDEVYYVLGPIGLFIPPLIFLYGVFGYIRNRKRKEYEPPKRPSVVSDSNPGMSHNLDQIEHEPQKGPSVVSDSNPGMVVRTTSQMSHNERAELARMEAELAQMRSENQMLRDRISSDFPEKAAPSPDSAPFDSDSDYLPDLPRTEIILSDPIPRRKPSLMPEIKYSNITVRSRIDRLFPFIVIDTETTGLDPNRSEIIEVSAVRYEEGFIPVSCFTTLCCPSSSIPRSASSVNHITHDMVAECPFFSQIASSLTKYISGCNIVGHNLPFDLKFLYAGGLDLSDSVRYYDTLQLARNTLTHEGQTTWDDELDREVPLDDYDVENYKLGTLCDYFGIEQSCAHRSLSDSYATGKLFENLVNLRKNK